MSSRDEGIVSALINSREPAREFGDGKARMAVWN
jgi:hypothetical protein